jgi:hypothetical protein
MIPDRDIKSILSFVMKHMVIHYFQKQNGLQLLTYWETGEVPRAEIGKGHFFLLVKDL